ncbi:MAG: deaminase [Phycisphaerales bacterium]|nr:deaminase [Phycisphaerales bacterium]
MTISANDQLSSEQRPDWDQYFLDLAEQISRRSPDPNTKHGCVLVDSGRRVLSTGYNGPVSGLPHDLVQLDRPNKYDWFIHAEDNAVAFARCDLRGATAYVTGTPCVACFRRLLQVGVRRIVNGDRQSACLDEREMDACQKMARAIDIEWIVYSNDGVQRLDCKGFSEFS